MHKALCVEGFEPTLSTTCLQGEGMGFGQETGTLQKRGEARQGGEAG